MTDPGMPAPAPLAAATTARLVRRQLIVAALGIAVVLLVFAFIRTQNANPGGAAGPVDEYLQAHLPPDPGNVHLAYLQLAAAAVTAVIALGHVALVAAFLFRRKAT